MNLENQFQMSLKSVDLKELLNRRFDSKKQARIIDNYKVSKILYKAGLRKSRLIEHNVEPSANDEISAIENWLEEEGDYFYAYDLEFAEVLFTKDSKPLADKCILQILAEQIGLNLSIIYSRFDYEGDEDSAVTYFEGYNQKEMDVILSWCEEFKLDYSVDEGAILVKDLGEENEMEFLFLYDDNQLVDWCAIDWSSGNDNVSNEIARYLADLDLNSKFSCPGINWDTRNTITDILNAITDTREVVF